ncbi:YbaB/EbfC family nucleoid-associated protein [Asanoa iriomotensis]|uniref:YbaB/EbfC DNA-binding family protein n=1 Tax=Asanoa iriomotensis TaxID=234613 RepID=A0ABQ4BX41_9ACTN|nr:YbaB/EbfC family nucleoid-associated protein [Asanoa iriomotensis]GIF55087.1 hypothetical protein Air01nite_11820 [Asanoa iriomotensis]
MHDFIERFLETSEQHYRSDVGPERLRAAAVEFQAGLQELMNRTVTATDASGYVEATVSLGGKLVRTYVSPHALRDLTAVDLAAVCVEAIAAARASAAETFQASVGDFPSRFADLDPADLIRRSKV